MKYLNFYGFTVFFLIGVRMSAISIGDYVDYTEDKNKLEYGTVMEVLGGGKLRIRPHRGLGDFIADVSKLPIRVIKDAKAIKELQPKKGEYSINLMWVKNKLDGGLYIFPDKGIEASLAKVVHWAKKNPSEKIVVWYDSAMVDPKAVINTYAVLSRIFPEQAKQIIFNDLRVFPEVEKDYGEFSAEIPIYFRVDLLRVIAAYNVIKKALEEGRKNYFVYSDIDVTPMSKDEIFDASTMMDLLRYGIVMAHGGNNEYQFENSFQIWSADKPNLLWAAKTAIIELNILRAERFLGIPKAERKPENLEQMVYNSYDDMFRFFYHMEGWGKSTGVGKLPGRPYRAYRLDSMRGSSLEFDIKDPELILEKGFIAPRDENEEKVEYKLLYIPRKVIEAPRSRFGGQPTRYPKEVTLRN